jgi:hypothetical protein
MHSGCECLGIDEKLTDPARRMAERNIGALPVCGGRPARLAVNRHAYQLAAFIQFLSHLSRPVPGIGEV